MRVSSNQVNNSGLAEILNRQSELRDLQLRIATQKRVLTPSDDPVAATSILNLETELSLLTQYQRNADFAMSSNSLEESVLDSVTNISFRLKELFVSIGNGVYTSNELQSIKNEIRERYEEMIGLANTQTANGDYLFSGFLNKTEPFTKNATGDIQYNGDQGQRELKVSSGLKVPFSDSGYDIFLDTLTGNGRLLTGANAANTGEGIIEPSPSAQSSITDSYEIQFTTATDFDIVNVTTATVVGTGTYTDGGDINYTAGAENFTVRIEGTPVVGDVFTIEPSQRQSIFTTLELTMDAIDNFSDVPNEKAIFRSTIIGLDGALNNFMTNVDKIRGKIGARINAIESEVDTNLSLEVNQRTTLSNIKDLDMIEAASELSRLTTVLEAAQASYVRVQNLTIFNFL